MLWHAIARSEVLDQRSLHESSEPSLSPHAATQFHPATSIAWHSPGDQNCSLWYHVTLLLYRIRLSQLTGSTFQVFPGLKGALPSSLRDKSHTLGATCHWVWIAGQVHHLTGSLKQFNTILVRSSEALTKERALVANTDTRIGATFGKESDFSALELRLSSLSCRYYATAAWQLANL